MEKRKTSRILFDAEATVKAGETEIRGKIDNLSMKGMFLNTREVLPDHDQLRITILLSGSSSALTISLKGRAVRRENTGIAVEFSEMDLDSFMHLKKVVQYNSDNADEIVEEYCKSLGKDF